MVTKCLIFCRIMLSENNQCQMKVLLKRPSFELLCIRVHPQTQNIEKPCILALTASFASIKKGIFFAFIVRENGIIKWNGSTRDYRCKAFTLVFHP